MTENAVKVQPLNNQDEYFLDTDTPTAPTHIGGLEIFRLPKGAKREFMQQLFEHLKNSPVRAEPFNYTLGTEQPEPEPEPAMSWLRPRLPLQRKAKPKPRRVWRRLDRVNVEEHLYLHALPYPGGQRELGELVARLHVNRLDRSRPLWEMHLIEGLAGGRYAVYTKLHHSQFDGKRGMVLSQYTRSTKASARNLPPVWSVQLPKVGKALAERPARPGEPTGLEKLASWSKALSSMRAVRDNKPGDGVIAPYSAPACILNGPLTARRRLGTQSLPMARLKAIGAAVDGGATVNEVLLAVCGGALRRYLDLRDALPAKPLIAACPVAVARKDDNAASGNAVGQMLVSLSTHIGNPRQRLLAVVASSRANKALMKALDGDAYKHYTELSMMPQVLAAKAGYGHKVLNANMVISNVPGSRETQFVNGAQLEAMYSASMLLAGQALNITVCNFGDNLDVGIMACPDLCPSPQKIAVYMGEELEILEQAIGLKRAARGRRALPGADDAPWPPALEKAATKRATAKKSAAKPVASKTAATKAVATTQPRRMAKPTPAKSAAARPALAQPATTKAATTKAATTKAATPHTAPAKTAPVRKKTVAAAAPTKPPATRRAHAATAPALEAPANGALAADAAAALLPPVDGRGAEPAAQTPAADAAPPQPAAAVQAPPPGPSAGAAAD